jgi:hypothetical protein
MHDQGDPPSDLDDAHARLLRILPAKTIEEMRSGTENDMIRYHHGLGTWIRNEWGLWRGSRLAKYFNEMGVRHPDDMSGIILDTFWDRLHEQPFRLKERVAGYAEYWASMATPEGASPRDGAAIAWGITKGSGKGAVHLGVSVSDLSGWRYEYGSGRGIEPAHPEEHVEIDDLLATWKRSGTKPEDIAAKPLLKR